jgi:hypothetical protein
MRKRMLLALTLVVGMFVFPGSASATHDLLDFDSTVEQMLAVDPTLDPPPNDGKHDFVVGGFQEGSTPVDINWGVSAHSGPSGEEPFGHVSATIPELATDAKQGRWRVTCVNVAGKFAAIGGVPTQAASNDADHALFVFRDGGPGGGTPVEPDGFQFFIGRIGDPQACHDPRFLLEAAVAPPIESGNILVHDAQP